jgi:hypothetical protein
MHNCKLTRRDFVDLALDEIPGARAKQLLAELNDCQACQLEYEALRSTLHISNRALRSSVPEEEFWRGYHSRLQSRLMTSEAQQIENAEPTPFHLWSAFKRALTTSVRVPLPAALALVLVLGVTFFVMQTRAQINRTPVSVATVETRTVEVPVIQEKIVTRVVYVEKKGERARSGVNRTNGNEVPASVTGSDAARTALSLVDFKPTEEVKLTVIKGSDKDQKR